MTAPRLLVAQHDPDDHLNELAGSLADFEIESWCTWVSERPSREPSGYDAIVSLGAVSGVGDWVTQPWMAVEARYLENLLTREKPILGVCFGSQLLAHVIGGEVFKAAHHEIGWSEVTAEPAGLDDPLLGSFGERYPAFQYHYDTFTLPPSTLGSDVVLLGRTGALNEAFRLGSNAWGLQFHLEANPGVVQAWLGAFPDDLASAGVDLDQLWADTRTHWRWYRDACWRLGDAFAARVG